MSHEELLDGVDRTINERGVSSDHEFEDKITHLHCSSQIFVSCMSFNTTQSLSHLELYIPAETNSNLPREFYGTSTTCSVAPVVCSEPCSSGRELGSEARLGGYRC